MKRLLRIRVILAGGNEEIIVKSVYAELEMEKEFREFERQSFGIIESNMRQMEHEHGLKSSIFQHLVKQLQGRGK